MSRPQGFAFGQGPKAENRRSGAPRGERPRMRRLRKLVCVGRKGARDSAFTRVFVALCAPCGPTSLARRRVPLHPSACRRSASLVLCEGTIWQASESNCLARTNKLAQSAHTGMLASRRSTAAVFGFRTLAKCKTLRLDIRVETLHVRP